MKTLFFNLKVFEKRIPCISCLIAVCLLLFFGSCSEQSKEFEVPETLDDAALVEAQLNQLHRTRANDAYSTVLITTAKSVNFQVVKTGRILVDWGDGNQEYDVFSHTYTDNFPAHTICFYDPDTTMTELGCFGTELIFLDLTKNIKLKKLNCMVNRLTKLDLSQNELLEDILCMNNQIRELNLSQHSILKNLDCSVNELSNLNLDYSIELEILNCMQNRLWDINLKNNSNLKKVVCTGNELRKIDVSHNIHLNYLACGNNEIDSLDLSQCMLLNYVYCADNNIIDLKISNESALQYIYCKNNPFESANNAVLSFIQGLPNRTGKDMGVLSFSPAINDSGCLSTVQTFCTIFNWELELFE